MKPSPFIKPVCLVLLFCFGRWNSIGQTNELYINQIKQRKVYVDSLIGAYYANPATALSHTIVHYNFLGSRGGSAELYQDVAKENILQLYYFFNYDTASTEKVYYFIDNKIVLVSIHYYDKVYPNEEKYYKDDNLLFDGNASTNTSIKKDKDLIDGYRILGDMKK